MTKTLTGLLFLLLLSESACGQTKVPGQNTSKSTLPMTTASPSKPGNELATFGSGCFWCTEAIFLDVKGVEKVTSGYAGGHVKNPTYREVGLGTTGHAEVTQIEYDPNQVTFDELLEIFWQTHDPTTLTRQGNDDGPQYRSAIFYHNELQKQRAELYKTQLEKEKVFDNPIVTEITSFSNFYPAEDYHQNYYALNPSQGYCVYVIRPKVDKFRKVFKDKLKKS